MENSAKRIRLLEEEIAKLKEYLKNSDQNYKNLMENSPDGIAISDLEGNLITANRKVLEMHGYKTLEELLANVPNVFASIVEEERALAYQNAEKVLQNGNVNNLVYNVLRKDGSTFLAELSSSLIKDAEGNPVGFMAITKDITDRISAEKELKETSERLSNIFKAANDGMWDWYLDTGKVVFDPRYYEMAGYKVDEFPYELNEFQSRVHPEDIGHVMEQANDHLEGRADRFLVEFRFKKKNNDWMWVIGRGIIVERDNNGRPLRLMGTHTDISEYKKIQEQTLKLSKAVEQSPEGIVITDKDGIIEYANPSFCKLTEYEISEIIAKNLNILNSGEHDKKFYKNLWDTILKGETWIGEMLNRKKGGSLYWERVVIAPIIKEDKSITHFVSLREDVTEKKKILQDLQREKERAEESDRLKSSFLANMSHEIRTPMNGILGFADLLRHKDLSEVQRDEYLKIIQKSGMRMLETINDIIDISKIESGQAEITLSKTNINDQLDYLYEFFLPEINVKGFEFLVKKPLKDEDVILYTDKEKFIAVISNLIKNAIKYSHSGIIEAGYEKQKDKMEFYVRDEGIGISEDRQKAIFDRFVQADLSITKAYEGSGLGLSISKGFVDLLGGKIWVESKEGEGSVFRFTIPINTPRTKTTEKLQKTMQENNTQFRNLSILIAEDDESAYFYLNEVMKRYCKKILRAETGTEAVKLSKQHKDLDLILMDIKMPEMDGFEATKQIRKFNKTITIIGQTAYAMVGDQKKVKDAGCNDYISKPIDKGRLFELLLKYF